MTIRIHVTVASIVTAVAAFAAIVPACAGGDKVAFPEDHAAGVLFTTVDRPDNKQFRELYSSAEALDAAKKGEPLPSGTVITLIQYAAKLDAQGNPEKDANGRFIKGNAQQHHTTRVFVVTVWALLIHGIKARALDLCLSSPRARIPVNGHDLVSDTRSAAARKVSDG
jgi:hypothetical protein